MSLKGDDSWKVRRTFLFATVFFSMLTVAYVLATGLDTKPAETAVMFAFITILGAVGSYVFGAAWEDINSARSAAASPDVTINRRARGRPLPPDYPEEG